MIIILTLTSSSLLRKPPSLRPRSSHPRSSVNMNDTYAVVNKFKQPSTAPPLVPHHYDNENLNSQKTSANDLYSIVKPKNRPVANTPASTVPAHDRTWQLNHRPPEHTDYSSYESLPGEWKLKGFFFFLKLTCLEVSYACTFLKNP